MLSSFYYVRINNTLLQTSNQSQQSETNPEQKMNQQLNQIDRLKLIKGKLDKCQYKQQIEYFYLNKNNIRQSKCNTAMLILILFMLLNISESSQCTPKHLTQNFNVSWTFYCQLQFNQCSSYQFQLCKVYQCPNNSHKQCFITLKMTSQSECKRYCCQNYNDPLNINSIYSIKFCKSQTSVVDSGVNKGVIFIWSIASIAIVVFIIICCIKWCKHRQRINNTQFNIQHTNPNHPTTNPTTLVNLAQFDMQLQGPYFINSQNSCAICLQNKVNLRTHCNHFYHGICLLAWIQKKTNNPCPLCMSINYNPVKVYCIECKIGDKLVNIETVTNQTVIKQYDLHKCQNCKNIVSEVFTLSQQFQFQYQQNKQDNNNKQEIITQVKQQSNNVLSKHNFNQSQDNQIQSVNQNDNVIISNKYLKQRKQRRKNRKTQSENKVIVRDKQLTESQKNLKSKSNNNVQI